MVDTLQIVISALKKHPKYSHLNMGDFVELPRFNNLIVSDQKSWHIKIAPPASHDVSSTLLGNEYQLLKQNPELSKLAPVDIITLPQPYTCMTVWEYALVENFTHRTFNLTAVQNLAQSLQAINNKTWGEVNPISFENRLNKIINRISYATQTNPTLYPSANLETLKLLANQWLSIPTPTKNLVLNHGDAHFNNYMLINGEPSLIDFESITYAPKEWDMATVSMNLRREFGREDLWEAFINEYNTVDMETLTQLEKIKTISEASWLLLHPKRSQEFNKRMEELTFSLKTGCLPDKYVNPIYHFPSKLSH